MQRDVIELSLIEALLNNRLQNLVMGIEAFKAQHLSSPEPPKAIGPGADDHSVLECISPEDLKGLRLELDAVAAECEATHVYQLFGGKASEVSPILRAVFEEKMGLELGWPEQSGPLDSIMGQTRHCLSQRARIWCQKISEADSDEARQQLLQHLLHTVTLNVDDLSRKVTEGAEALLALGSFLRRGGLS